MSRHVVDLSVDRHRPAEYHRLGRLLAAVYLAGQPGRSRDLQEPSSHQAPSSRPPGDAPDGSRFRTLYDTYRKACGRLADDLEIEMRGGGLRGQRCPDPDCRTGARTGARYCDRCGQALEGTRTQPPKP
jgi:hypothetical protein